MKAFRRDQLTTRESIRATGLEFHRHYAGSMACTPSRATLFTGQYPSLHGVSATDGAAKQATDPEMTWLDPDSVPTLGDWFRAGVYQTHYRGKWHVSHADLLIPGTHEGLMASDDSGTPIPEAIEAYRRADRLDPFGFSGWIGREPHGAAKSDCGMVRDGVFAEQIVELFDELAWRAETAPGWPSHRSSTPTTSPSTASAGTSCSVSALPTTRCPRYPRPPPKETASQGARRARRRSRPCGRR